MKRTLTGLVGTVVLLLGLVVFLPSHGVHAQSIPLLPGESLINGVPSFDFGTNDGVNWDPQYNMDVPPDGPVIQGDLKSAGIPISRVWFFQNSLVDNHALTDAEQLQKLQAVQASGMLCFANLPTENTVSYDLHLVALLKGSCPYFEVMNEPDIETAPWNNNQQIDPTAYLNFWNSFVPQARGIDPSGLFGGPAEYDNQGDYCTYNNDGTSECFLQKVMLGMKASGNLPDFITYHWYPCWNNTAAQCLALAGSFNSAAQQVIDWATGIFGKPMPVICSEWNADPGSPNFMFDRTWDAQYVTAATQNIETSGLSGAMEFDTSSYGNYSADDLFDIYSGGAPFQTFTAYASELARVRGGGPTPTSTPSTPTPVPPTPTSTPVPPTPTPVPPTPSPTTTPTPGGSLSLVQSGTSFIDYAGVNTSYGELPKDVGAGHLLIAQIAVAGGNNYTVGSVTSELGDTWHRAVWGQNGDETDTEIWYTNTISSGSDGVTATLVRGPGSTSVFVQTLITLSEWSGPGVLDGAHAHESTGLSHGSGSVLAKPGDVVVGFYADAGYDSTLTTNKTLLGSPQDVSEAIQGIQSYQIATGTTVVVFKSGIGTYGEVAAAAFG